MKRYTILSSRSECDLEKNVEKYLAQGWQLAGGLSVAVVPAGILGPDPKFYQAMVK